MKKRPKLQAAILAALASSSYADDKDDNCFDYNKSLPKVLECFQNRLDTQRLQLDTQQAQMGKLAAESQALQTDKQQLQQANTALTKRLTKLEDTVTGPNRLLTFSSFVELDKKAVIKPGEEWKAPKAYSTFRRGQFRIALWVTVPGHFDHTQSTTVNVYYHDAGLGTWDIDSQIGDWKILGRDWGNRYIDLNISKVSHYNTIYRVRTFKLKNVGEKNLEIFAYGVIQGPSGHIQR